MTYKVEFTNRSKPPLYVNDGEFNTQTPITMFGQYTENYGTALWTNLLQYLEHYANDTEPVNAVEGQLWFDTKNNMMKINTGRIVSKPVWEVIKNKPVQDISKLLLRSGGTCTADLQLTGDIVDDNQAVTKKYVESIRDILFESASDKYQYNIMSYNGFMTLNGIINQSEFTNGKFTVMLPKYMANTDYTVMLTVGSTLASYTHDLKDPFGHHYYVTDKTVSSFVINVDDAFPSDGELQLCVTGFIKSAYKS
jgi:hypothetical protein